MQIFFNTILIIVMLAGAAMVVSLAVMMAAGVYHLVTDK